MRQYFVAATAALLAVSATTAYADVLSSRVVSYDQAKRQLHLTDRTIVDVDLKNFNLPVPAKQGDRVEITYDGSENGIDKIRSIKIVQ
ncbi:hypothetical protein GR183_17560 [Stappia sp. GBMRC 2046]|uniref:DUF1344 domain-containing protein n=1 Tax=Stappia sediminis TaxID=2692190 RepID=A0A7X3LX44_9HYPH|nr:hypothetical protein [Stappia sediminis]MXN66725.1 hypothetical protein [Stappia sediminis]